MKIQSSKVTHQTIDGEVIIIHFESGNYFSLTGSAAQIWQMLDAGLGREAILALFQAQAPGLTASVDRFLGELVGEGLCEEAENAGTSTWTEAVLEQEPVLTRFDDMKDMLLADPLHEVEPTGWPNVKPQ